MLAIYTGLDELMMNYTIDVYIRKHISLPYQRGKYGTAVISIIIL
jgi:hypothetical protein